jgi:hypothetical protein
VRFTLTSRAWLVPAALLLTLALGRCKTTSSRPEDPLGSTGAQRSAAQAAPATSARPDDPRRFVRVLFTTPARSDGTTPDARLREELVRLWDAALPGSSVRVSAYDWDEYWNGGPPWGTGDRDGPACWKPVQRAIERGVDVSVVFNEEKSKEPVRAWLLDPTRPNACQSPAQPEKSSKKWGRVRTRVCETRGTKKRAGGSCLGNHNLHAKFTLFSAVEVDGRRVENVIVTSSASYDYHQIQRWNDALLLAGDTALYTAFVGFFEQIFAFDRSGSAHWPGIPTAAGHQFSVHGELGISASFFPSPIDTVRQTLESVDCRQGGQIRVAMANWTRSKRGTAIAEALGALRAAGCTVDVILSSDESFAPDAVLVRLRALGLLVRRVPPEMDVHMKLVVIDARDSAGKPLRRVITGSQNFTDPALTANEEVVLSTDDAAIFSAYVSHWENLSRHAPR